jgi:hypothetical protein
VRDPRRGESGSAVVALLVGVALCGALSAAVLLTNSGRSKEALAELAAHRAFQLAEAGADWGVAQIRIRDGVVPTSDHSRTVPGVGTFTITYAQGDANGFDDNGDTVVDDPAERSFATLRSTGTANRISRSIQVVMRHAVEISDFDAAARVDVDAPICDLNGEAFVVDGKEHLVDGTVDGSRPAKFGLTSSAVPTVVTTQIGAGEADQVNGSGPDPSVGMSPSVDLPRLMEQSKAAAGFALDPGTHSSLSLGTPAAGSTVVAWVGGDLTLTGTCDGAGILVVEGDLTVTGALDWRGVILVGGRVRMTGGGGAKRVVGVLATGEDLTIDATGSPLVPAETVSILYSSDAIQLAATRFETMSVMAWREVANP